MGFDCGFDIWPRLEPTPENMAIYTMFLAEVTDTYSGVYDDKGRRADGKVLVVPADERGNSADFDSSYIWFMVGECPHIPSSADRCDYFLRFSSKVSGGLTTSAKPYIDGVYEIARKHFGGRVHYWHEMNESGDERQWGFYTWLEIREAGDRLRELESRAGPEQESASNADGSTSEAGQREQSIH